MLAERVDKLWVKWLLKIAKRKAQSTTAETEQILKNELVLVFSLGGYRLRRGKDFVQIAKGTTGRRPPADDVNAPVHHR